MIDHLSPYEGVVFGALIGLGILSMLSAEENTQTVGACLLAAGFWGGVIALVRALVHREPGGLYVISFVAALIAGLMKFFVFSDLGKDGGNRVIWTFIIGIGLAGLVGTALNALIRKPPEDPEAAAKQASPDLDESEEAAPLHGMDEAVEESAAATDEVPPEDSAPDLP